jgi:ubiquinone/menaquinone biosynthesis C-methylase UbiE
MLESRFPSLESMTGIDLSTFKLAVCENKRRNEVPNGDKYKLFHAPAESSPVASNSQDLACLCLVAHESPEWVTQSIFKEAHRILKPGGYFTMLDLDKENLEVLLRNPFVAAIYKRTEPYMGEYIKLNTRKELEKLGFEISEVDNASRSHKVYVAKKM